MHIKEYLNSNSDEVKKLIEDYTKIVDYDDKDIIISQLESACLASEKVIKDISDFRLRDFFLRLRKHIHRKIKIDNLISNTLL